MFQVFSTRYQKDEFDFAIIKDTTKDDNSGGAMYFTPSNFVARTFDPFKTTSFGQLYSISPYMMTRMHYLRRDMAIRKNKDALYIISAIAMTRLDHVIQRTCKSHIQGICDKCMRETCNYAMFVGKPSFDAKCENQVRVDCGLQPLPVVTNGLYSD